MRSMYHGPGRYVIWVAGMLDRAWSDRLGGLTITELETGGEDAVPVAELSGWLADQAALYGVLNTLYDNRYPLLYVNYLGPAEASADHKEIATVQRTETVNRPPAYQEINPL